MRRGELKAKTSKPDVVKSNTTKAEHGKDAKPSEAYLVTSFPLLPIKQEASSDDDAPQHAIPLVAAAAATSGADSYPPSDSESCASIRVGTKGSVNDK